MTHQRTGLRERKRMATRRALQTALYRLALDRGYDAVTIEEVAAAADVSPRTFFNYFASKDDAVAGAPIVHFDEDAEARFVAGGTGRLLADVAELVVASAPDPDDLEVHRLRRDLMRSDPALVGLRSRGLQAIESELGRVVAARLRTDRPGEGEAAVREDAHLMAMLALGLTRHGWWRWMEGAGEETLPDCVRAAFADGLAEASREAVPIG